MNNLSSLNKGNHNRDGVRIDFYDFISLFSPCFSFDWEDISNTKDRVWPHFQTPWSWLKILRYASYLQLSSLCLEMWSNTVCPVCYITSKTRFWLLQVLNSWKRAIWLKSASLGKNPTWNVDPSSKTRFRLLQLGNCCKRSITEQNPTSNVDLGLARKRFTEQNPTSNVDLGFIAPNCFKNTISAT